MSPSDEEPHQHFFVIVIEQHAVIVDRRFEHVLLEGRLVIGQRSQVAVGDIVRVGEDRRAPFHVEEPHRPAKVEVNLLRIEQVEDGHVVPAKPQMLKTAAEQLGFDGLAINEHHSMVYSMTPTVSLMAARLGAVTERAKIQVAGTPINLQYPNRVSEEYAMLDVMSGGKIILEVSR